MSSLPQPRNDLPPSQGDLPFESGTDGAASAGGHWLLSRALGTEPDLWDELRDAEGQLRPLWRRFSEHLPAGAGAVALAQDLDRRAAQLAQRIRQDGITHNVFGEGAQGAAMRPWSLELLPLLIDAQEWAALEAGVRQRAELLQQVLADCYGPQRLLAQGLLPPALLWRHPGYLRSLQGTQPAPGPDGQPGLRLFIVAFDLARGPDGQWCVVSQRTQGPSGLGYVLQNRLLISRQFPEAFRALRVQRLASSYRRLLDTLEAHAAAVARRLGQTAPRVVLLTPGPYSDTYYEHAFLARYLGLPLVEGGDLTVRDDRLYLKTVEGLEPVHGVMRRLDDDWCDPLELRADSALGVPGLLQAARAGHVVMANALGSGFLESPAIQGFLPAIAEHLLGEPLSLPALPSWWCGEAAAWADARDRLDDTLLRTSFPSQGRLSKVVERSTVRVAEDPDAWTVQARIKVARAPIWGGGLLASRPAMVRVYAIADAGGGWHVLPGGMTRVARRDDGSISLQRGGTSLDTWVLTDGEVDAFSMLPQRLQVDDLAARHRPVSSRTGENLFWLGRYTERTELQLQLVRALVGQLEAGLPPPPLLQGLSVLALRSGIVPWGTPTLTQAPAVFERALLAALTDSSGQQGATSLGFNLEALARASSALRERLSAEQWGLIRQMREDFGRAFDQPPYAAQVPPALDRLALQLAAVTGVQTDRMTRDHGWRLLAVGRLLERLIGLSQRLALALDGGLLEGPHAGAGADLLLELFDSQLTFRARYQRHEDLLALVDLLVLDSTNPRSFGGVLRRLRLEIGKLPGSDDDRAVLLALLPAEGAGLALDDLRQLDEAALVRRLRSLADDLGRAAMAVADRIGERYFTLARDVDRRV